jgi:hypothetical protein
MAFGESIMKGLHTVNDGCASPGLFRNFSVVIVKKAAFAAFVNILICYGKCL